MASSVPSGSTRILGDWSIWNGPGWSTRTGGDQLAPPSVVRENSTVLVLGRLGTMKLAQATYACPASVGLAVTESVSLPCSGAATVAGPCQLRPPLPERLATTAVVGGSVEMSAARPLK